MLEHGQYIEAYRAHEKAAAGSEPAWLTARRRAAIAAFERLGFPHMKMEDWRYTNLKNLASTQFAVATAPLDADLSGLVKGAAFAGFDRHLAVVAGGVFMPELSKIGPLPSGVTLMGLGEALEKHGDIVRQYLGGLTDIETYAFQALNTAFMRDGLFLRVAEGVMLDKPVHVVHVNIPGSEPTAGFPRTLIALEKGAEAVIIESHIGPAGSTYFTNDVGEIYCGEESTLRYHRIFRDSRDAYHFCATAVRQETGSDLRSLTVNLGGALVRNDIFADLTGDGIESSLDGLYHLDGDRQMDNFTRVRHLGLDGNSRQIFKGILDGSSRGIFDGRIFVREGAQQTDAVQTNRNLLLSDDAVAYAKPQLEIYADDVKCTHGATTGQLDADQIFYLRARGFAPEDARAVLTYAFAGELIEEIAIEPVRERLEQDLRILMTGH